MHNRDKSAHRVSIRVTFRVTKLGLKQGLKWGLRALKGVVLTPFLADRHPQNHPLAQG